jgi:hypothetical protein
MDLKALIFGLKLLFGKQNIEKIKNFFSFFSLPAMQRKEPKERSPLRSLVYPLRILWRKSQNSGRKEAPLRQLSFLRRQNFMGPKRFCEADIPPMELV